MTALSHPLTAGEIGVSVSTLAVTLVTWAQILKSLNGSNICIVNKEVRSHETRVISVVASVCLWACMCRYVNKNGVHCLWSNTAIILRVFLPSSASLCSGCISYLLSKCLLARKCLAHKLCLISTSFRSWFPQCRLHMWCRVHQHVCMHVTQREHQLVSL